MPRIDAPTVAEHRARQRRALLDAARELLAESGQEPSMTSVGRRAGLARSSVYQYFPSSRELMAAVVADVFPDWAGRVRERVAAADSPAARVWTYVEANIALFTGEEQAVAQALMRVVDPSILQAPMQAFHAELQVPLQDALAALGEPEPGPVAELIDAMILQAVRTAGADASAALARLHRLLDGYVQQR